MSLIDWSDALSLGVPGIDAQHQRLVSMLNDLYAAVLALRGQSEITAILSSMVAYSQEHFTFEESEMARCRYAEEKLHRAEHHAFIEFAEKTEARMKAGEFVSSVELLGYLRDWLTNHIQSVDRKYCSALRTCQPAEGAAS